MDFIEIIRLIFLTFFIIFSIINKLISKIVKKYNSTFKSQLSFFIILVLIPLVIIYCVTKDINFYINILLYIMFFFWGLLSTSSVILSLPFALLFLYFFSKYGIMFVLNIISTQSISWKDDTAKFLLFWLCAFIIYVLLCNRDVAKLVCEILGTISTLLFTIVSFIQSSITNSIAQNFLLSKVKMSTYDLNLIIQLGYSPKELLQIIAVIFLPSLSISCISILLLSVSEYTYKKYSKKYEKSYAILDKIYLNFYYNIEEILFICKINIQEHYFDFKNFTMESYKKVKYKLRNKYQKK